MSLTTEERQQVTRGLMRWWSQFWEEVSINKLELYAAVGATDDWIEANQVSFNAALPEAARNGLTAIQKTVLFCAVAARRVSLDFARRLFGGVD